MYCIPIDLSGSNISYHKIPYIYSHISYLIPFLMSMDVMSEKNKIK